MARLAKCVSASFAAMAGMALSPAAFASEADLMVPDLGSVTFVGPKGRLIKSAAENIYPAEVESCLQRHPAVKEAAVIGIPDKKWDQSVKAIIVLKDGERATAEELIEHCRANIASYKKPRTVEFIDEMPRDGWLVDYDALDQRFGGGGYPGGGR